ncbi:MAG: DNRLRE domain-containing protein [Thermodesulfobacteriota bacterium]|nr:DNRLRE domain-containing protein [Thermodesulfobacteriota bacterium]
MTKKAHICFRPLSVWCVLLLLPFLVGPAASAADQPIIIDHTCTDITEIPESAINAAKALLHIGYGHTSHGSQLTSGMSGLVGFANNGGLGLTLPEDIFKWNNGGVGGALDLEEGDGYGSGWLDHDCGYYPNWVGETRAYLDDPSHADVNVIIWSWCGQASGRTEQAMLDTYLTPMSQLEAAYPDVTFVYMTGHADGSGETGNLHLRNEQIRDYCIANNKVLYDYYDIECYDPDGAYFGDKLVNDGCYYDTDGNGSRDGNWATEWQDAHPEGVDWYSCGSAHSQPLNANRKAYAAWWLWARLGELGACLPAPSALAATPDSENGEIALNWTDNASDPNEDSFIIQRQVDGGAWDNDYSSVPADTTSYLDSDLAIGTYHYRVVAHLDDDGSGNPCDSGPSNVATAVISSELPAAPSELSSDLNGFDITLHWTDNSDNEESFIVERKVDGNDFSILATLPANVETYLDDGLTPLRTYTYRVKAQNNYGDSGYSNETWEFTAEEEYTITMKQGVDGYTGCKDAYLDAAHPDTNYGNTLYKHVLHNPKCNLVVSFDLPPEVTDKKILAATMGFYCWTVSGWDSDQYLDLYGVTEAWEEGATTWNVRTTGNNWTTAGGASEPEPLDHVLIPNQSFYPEFDITTLVQTWVDGTQGNHGVLMKNDSVADTGIKASEYSEYGRPYLEITYTGKPACVTDRDEDGDVDGSDLAAFASDLNEECLGAFADAFGE